jgi:signal transduction histidine kinase
MLHYLVNDMVDLIGIKNGKFRKNERLCNIREEIQQVVDILGEPCKQKKLEFSFFVDDRVPDVMLVDMQRVKQIFMNLLQNAIKFTYKGGVRATLSFDPRTSRLIGKVEDSGIGIPEKDLRTLF